MAKEKPSVSLRRLRAIPKSPLSVGAIAFALAIEAAFHAQLPITAGYLVDRVLGARDRDVLISALSLPVVGFVAAQAAGLIRDWTFARLQSRAISGIRQGVFERLQRLSSKFHTTTGRNEILELFTGDLATIETAWSTSPAWCLLPAAECLICSGSVLALDWRIGLLSLLLWPWVLLAPKTFARHLSAASERCRDEEVRILGVIEESLTARPVIRAFSLEQLGLNLFRKRNEILARGMRQAGFLLAAMDRFTQLGILFLQLMILALSAVLTFDDQLTAGKLVSVPILTYLLGQSLRLVSQYAPSLSAAAEAWQRIRETLRDPSPVPDKIGAKALPPLHNEIAFQQVSVGEKLRDLTAFVKRGTHVAFVGPAGSGIDEIKDLLLRFRDPSGGVVTFDGHDLKSVAQASLRARIGTVLAENFVFSASIRENIRLANPASTEERLRDLMRASGIAAMAAELPQGPETPVGENGYPIGAEFVQRIAVARALLKEPDVLLLDEATSRLDASAEKAATEAVKRLSAGRTLISITHRLSSAADADLIYVLDGGAMVEQGSHFELMAAQGVYANLWRKQAGFRFSADGSHVDVDAQRLKLLPVLERIDEEILAELAPFFATTTYPPGREIVCQNDPGDQFYIIARGKVEVWRLDEATGENTCMARLQDGDYFGEITLITGFPRTATVRAVTVCTCISIGRGQFERLIDRYPELRKELSATASLRLQESSGTAHRGAAPESAPGPVA